MRPLRILIVALFLTLIAAPAQATTTEGLDLIGHSEPADWSPYTHALMQSWDFAKEADALAAGVTPIEYKDLTSTRDNDCGTNVGGGSPCIVNGVKCPTGVNDAPNYATGLGFCWTYRNHPGWFYKRSGKFVIEANFPTQYLMDWQRPAYQTAWANAVVAAAQAHGWTWVWGDNALANPNSYTSFPTYGGASNTQAATQAMLAKVTPILNAAGVHLIANVGWTNLYPTVWNAWLPLVDGEANQHSTGDVAGNKAACVAQAKTCVFGDSPNGIEPTFQVVRA